MDRKLAAILSADVQGYSRLMSEDEAATVRTITAYRELMAALIHQQGGRVVDATGDNLLAEFASVVNAVQCAVEIQQGLKARNAELLEHRRMEFRIGINLGDVIVDGERIYGDGVNIAARVQGLADAGGVCISGTVYDQIKHKLALGYHSLGAHDVKNIAEPVRVYRVRMDVEPTMSRARPDRSMRLRSWRTVTLAAALIVLGGAGVSAIWQRYQRPSPPPAETAARRGGLPLPDKPSIAVLPFANMSGDPEQEYFSDGMTEDLITDLSKLSGLFVIARHSTFSYKGTSVKVQQVSDELGVRYVLEGSVRKADNRVRVTAQLVDATTGHHLWAERYDQDLTDVFALQDEITRRIVAALAVRLTEAEQARLGGTQVALGILPETRAPTADLDAYDAYLRGAAYTRRFTKEANVQARQMFEKAVALDPEYAEAYAGLGWTYFHAWTMQWSRDSQTLERAFQLAQKARDLDSSLAACRVLLAHVYLWKKQHARAIAEAEWAIALDPNNADNHMELGEILTWAGKPEDAIRLVETAMRLNPRYPFTYLWALGHAHWMRGQHADAIVALKALLARNPDFVPAHGYLAATYSELGRQDEARAAGAEVRRLSPRASLEQVRERLPYADEAALERFLGAVRRAGLE